MSAPVVTPASPFAIEGKQTQAFTADQAVTWSTSAGAITSGGLYTPPNVTGNYTVTATNGGGESTVVTVSVEGVFPALADYATPLTLSKKVRIFTPESGPRQAVGRGLKQSGFDLKRDDDALADVLELMAFGDAHYPHKRLIYRSIVLGITGLYEFDSNLKIEPISFDRVSWSCVIREAG